MIDLSLFDFLLDESAYFVESPAALWQGERDQEGVDGENGDQNPHSFAIDRALACHLLHRVYDASPLVRAEVALALTRLALGHSVDFQVLPCSSWGHTARCYAQPQHHPLGL